MGNIFQQNKPTSGTGRPLQSKVKQVQTNVQPEESSVAATSDAVVSSSDPNASSIKKPSATIIDRRESISDKIFKAFNQLTKRKPSDVPLEKQNDNSRTNLERQQQKWAEDLVDSILSSVIEMRDDAKEVSGINSFEQKNKSVPYMMPTLANKTSSVNASVVYSTGQSNSNSSIKHGAPVNPEMQSDHHKIGNIFLSVLDQGEETTVYDPPKSTNNSNTDSKKLELDHSTVVASLLSSISQSEYHSMAEPYSSTNANEQESNHQAIGSVFLGALSSREDPSKPEVNKLTETNHEEAKGPVSGKAEPVHLYKDSSASEKNEYYGVSVPSRNPFSQSSFPFAENGKKSDLSAAHVSPLNPFIDAKFTSDENTKATDFTNEDEFLNSSRNDENESKAHNASSLNPFLQASFEFAAITDTKEGSNDGNMSPNQFL